MNRLQIQLSDICRKKGLTSWEQVRTYAYDYKKYDNLTLRQIDEVVISLKN